MQKPVCPKCARYYRPKKNGTPYIEMKPIAIAIGQWAVPTGNTAPDLWEPYKLWMGDLWECLGCGNEIIVGTGSIPVSEDYKPDFLKCIESFNAEIRINDC